MKTKQKEKSSKKHKEDEVHTPQPPQDMNPSIPPKKQRGPQEREKKKAAGEKDSKGPDKLAPREEL